MNTDIIFFKDGELELKVNVSEERDTVWLDCQQIAELFGRDIKTIGKHINHVLKNELDNSTVAKNATIQKEGNRKVKREIEYYNLDMILAVGYRVNSKRGVAFRK